ncbi:hypothetical protein EV424DRAFT_1314970, partial [Suillus variegatus]
GRLRDDLNNFLFGFGRRICPGQHVANRSVSIGTVLILWAFRLTLDPTQPLDDTWVHEFGENIPAVLYQI